MMAGMAWPGAALSPYLRTAVDPENARPGWIALGLVLALCVATYLLWRSMNRQLNKITVPPRGAARRSPGYPPAASGEPTTDEAEEPAVEPPPAADREDVPRPLDAADGSGAKGQDPPDRS